MHSRNVAWYTHMNFHLLALETSSSVCGVALLSVVDGQTRVRTASHDATGEHAERLLPMVDQLLREAGIARDQLGAIAFGQGPGGFTGLRVACGVAQGMAFALDLPVIPVVSLLAAATLEAGEGDDVRVVAQDARMGEVYVAAYGKSVVDAQSPAVWTVLHDPVLMSANDVSHWIGLQASSWAGESGQRLSITVLGDALEAYPQLGEVGSGMQENTCSMLRLGAPLRATAEAVARLGLEAWRRGEAVPADQARPLYVRDKVAYTTAEREQGLGGNPKADGVVAIEPLTQAHLNEVVAIEQSVQSFPWTQGNFADALEAGYGAWVACNGEKIVGFCVVMFAPDVAHLLLIAVAPEAQRKGVGKLLLRQVEHESLARNLMTIILEVRPSNQKALAFYGHRGFKQLSVRKGYYPNGKSEREDGWVLEKQIGKAGADRHD